MKKYRIQFNNPFNEIDRSWWYCKTSVENYGTVKNQIYEAKQKGLIAFHMNFGKNAYAYIGEVIEVTS